MKNLRHYLLATVSSAAFVGNAAAADMPTKAAPAPVSAPIVWNWSGPYIGLNLGAAWNNAKFSDLGGTVPAYAFFVPGTRDPFWSANQADFTIGGQAGYNFQAGNIVYGIEADLNWVDGKASATFSPPLVGSTVIATSKYDWMATIRGRLGLSFSQWLIYGTGGVAFARFSDAWGFAVLGANEFTNNETRTGWTAGGGVEYMFARNWTARVEGLFADFGSTNLTLINPGGQSGTYSTKFQHTVTTVRGALNWKW